MCEYSKLQHRMNYLPSALERNRRRHRELVAEAKKYRMFDILTPEERDK